MGGCEGNEYARRGTKVAATGVAGFCSSTEMTEGVTVNTPVAYLQHLFTIAATAHVCWKLEGRGLVHGVSSR